jgi:hypothetical protein
LAKLSKKPYNIAEEFEAFADEQKTKARSKSRCAPVAQWIEQCSSKALMLVRFQPGAPKNYRIVK